MSNLKYHRLLKQWLKGSTCNHHTSIMAENDEYIVLKHHSHYEYVNRMTGSITCRAYVALYQKDDTLLERLTSNTDGDLPLFIEGPITLKKVLETCKSVYNIIFDMEYKSSEWVEEKEVFNALRDKAQKLTIIDGIKF